MLRMLGLLAAIGFQSVAWGCAGSNTGPIQDPPSVRVVHDDPLVVVTRIDDDEALQPASRYDQASLRPAEVSRERAEDCGGEVTTSSEAKTEGSVAFDLTTTGDRVARLRSAARELTAAHNSHFFDGIDPAAAQRGGRVELLTDVRSTAVAIDRPGGVRLVYKPSRASDLPELRDQMRSRIRSLRGLRSLGSCRAAPRALVADCPGPWQKTTTF